MSIVRRFECAHQASKKIARFSMPITLHEERIFKGTQIEI